MAEEKIYPYAVANIRAQETKLIDKQTLLAMADAKSPEDALRMLVDAGYGSQSSTNAYDFEKILSVELSKTYKTVAALVTEANIVDVFLFKNDYHNMKVLLKAEVSNVLNADRFLVDGGTLPLDTIKTAIAERSYSSLPKEMADGIESAMDMFSKTKNAQMIDIELDKATFKSMLNAANESENDFVLEFVKKLCDLTNLKSVLRIKKMNKGFESFAGIYVEGGKLSLDKFKQAFNNDVVAGAFLSTDYAAVCEGMKDGFTTFERLCDDYLMNFVKGAKFVALTLEPLLAFVYAKESEIKSLRIIMSSKINKIEPQIIKERLRDAYV